MNLLLYSRVYILFAAQLIELGGALVIVGRVAHAVYDLIRWRAGGIERARLSIANGVLGGLSCTVAATLLKTAVLQTWTQIGMLAFIFLLRLVLKRAFTYERRQLQAQREQASHAGATATA